MQYYFVKTNYPEAEISFYNSIDECLMAVIDGKVGCTTLNGMMANDILKNRKYRGLSLKQQNVMDDRCFGVLLGDAGLLKLLNRGLSIVGSEQAMNKKYDIIFLDHMMPYKDGIEALHELKALKNNPNADTPAICLTANAITGMREMYIAAGFDDYLTKPIDPGSLEEAIIKFLPNDKIKPAEERQDSSKEAGGNDKLPDFLSEIDGLDVAAGISHLGDIPSYIDTLKAYEETVSATALEIEKSYEEGNIKNLTTRVHAIKSTSRIIGAIELSKLAEELEMAGKDGNMQVISEGIGTLLADYSRMEEIAERLEKSTVPSEYSETVERIVNAISDFDYDEAFSMLNI